MQTQCKRINGYPKAVYPIVRSRQRLPCASALVMRPCSDSMTRLIAKWMRVPVHHYRERWRCSGYTKLELY